MDKNFLDTLTKDGDAYLIASADDLCNFSEYVNAGNDCKDLIFKLANNIDLRDVENFTPIGTKENPFAGTFDGDGKTISNLKIVGKNYVGLFGRLKPDWDKPFGTIKNINLSDASVSGKEYVGGLVGSNDGTVENCSVSGNVCGEDATGGLVGKNDDTIENCIFSGSVSGRNFVGGLVGQNPYGGTTENCTVSGSISGENEVGGLVGDNSGMIENCSASGNVNVSKRDEII